MATVTYPCYQQRKDSRGEWRWTFYAKNGEEIAVSSESYINRSDCTSAIYIIRDKNDHHPIFYFD
jgi:uncharacterized protein YegP (UPF0339 family)